MQPTWIGETNPLDELPERHLCEECDYYDEEWVYNGQWWCEDCLVEHFSEALDNVVDPAGHGFDIKWSIYGEKEKPGRFNGMWKIGDMEFECWIPLHEAVRVLCKPND